MRKRIAVVFMTVLLMISVLFMSSTVAHAKTALKITKEPASVKVLSGQEAKVTVKAKGDGLTYKWYYKNKGAKKYTLSKTVKKNTYTVKMKNSVNGRKVYCVITDKYGKTVKTKAVTLSKGTAVKVTKKPSSVTADCGSTAKVSVTAKGDGLTYQWYYKNKGDKKYTRSKTAKKKTYSVKMTSSVNGRRVYCVIKDKYGKTVQTKSVKLSLKHVYDSGKVTKKATCQTEGQKVYTCKGCKITKKETLKKTGHSFSGWKVYTAATLTSKGVERNKCKDCTYYKDRTTDKFKTVYHITVNTGSGKAQKVAVAADGKYSLETPKKVGYKFTGWKTSDGKSFASSGVSKKNVTVTAQWELDPTDTLEELIEKAEAGFSEIVIEGDITVTKPVYISHKVKIYSDGDYTIKRSPSYKGDIFVVGQDKNGVMSSLLQRKAVLDLGGGKGTLTIDGNRDNLKTTVVGSALFISDSSEVNIYDGVKIVNHKKLGNERALTYVGSTTGSSVSRAGGSALLILNATVNIYGGEISNNAVATEYTSTTNEDGTVTNSETNACGGAVYNRGNINMYGGVISGNEALRGGGIYTDRIVYLFAGTISDNVAHTYGGGVASSSSSDADIFVGTADGESEMIFSGNSSTTGGALYANTSSPIIIYGNAKFTGNSASSGGGAIHTAGPLTIRGSVFEDNSTPASGGAIYHAYVKESFERRLFEISDCVLENNSASLGGAIILSASNTVLEAKDHGTYATVTNCTFLNNKAVKNDVQAGNGGAVYITRKSEAVFSGCSFDGNTAAGNAGAVSVQSSSKAQFTDCDFTGNTGLTGGAVYSDAATTLTMKNIQFSGNKAAANEKGSGGNGGAIYINDAQVSFDNLDFEGNSADNHAGAVYACATDLTLNSSFSFVGNSAKNHGGALYLTYKTNSDKTKDGAILTATGVTFENNSAMAGGAISARTDCGANLDSVILKGNSVEGDDGKADGNADGGGAVYVGYGTLTLTNVTATGNSSSDFGGVIDAVASPVTVTGGTFSENSSKNGGLIYALEADVSIRGAVINKNKSVYENTDYNTSVGGGAVSTKSGKLTVVNSIFDENETGYYGGTIHANKTAVSISGNTSVTKSKGATGAALYFINGCTVTLDSISVSDNTSSSNGVIYINGGTLDFTASSVLNNKAYNGGVFYISGASTVASLEGVSFSGNTGTSGGVAYFKDATLNIKSCQFSKNTAKLGGVTYSEKGTLNIQDASFTENTASANGGVIDIVGTVANLSGTTSFTNNSAAEHGGAIYVNYIKAKPKTETTAEVPAAYSALTVDGCTFDANNAMAGGAVSVRTGSVATFNGTAFTGNLAEGHDGKADGDADGGGAIYVGYGTVNLNNVTATGNETKESLYVNDKNEEKLYGFGGFLDGLSAEVNFVGGTVSGNKAPSGGAVNMVGAGNILTVDGTTFANNESTYLNSEYDNSKGGGAFNVAKTKLNISNATFDGNSTKWYGGTVIASGSDVTVDKSVFTNSKGATGAALNFKSSSTAVITDTAFNNNISSYNGVVYANSTALTMDGVTATGNKAVNGGVLYVSGASTTVDMKECTFTGNNATNGGIAFTENAALKYTDCDISENTATKGGAVYIKKSSAKVQINSCPVSKNSAKFGGVLYSENGSTVELNGAEFTENTASANGGVIYTEEAKALTVSSSVFSKNYSKSNGGALYVYRTATTLADSVFTENTTDAHGGAVNNIGSVITATGNNSFTSNKAANHGGAVYVTYISAKAATDTEPAVEAAVGILNVTGGTFSGNTALGGGAISARTGCEAHLNGTVLTGNSVEGFAGKDDGDGDGGGAIYVGFGTLSLTDVIATGNTASGFGGAVDSMAATVTVTGGTFSGNTANAGGAIYGLSASEITVSGATFTGNESVFVQDTSAYDGSKGGGAINIKGGKLNISAATFDGNKTKYYGGAVHTSATAVSISGNTTVKNSTGSTGAALYFRDASTVIMENTSVTDNTSTSNGVIYMNGGILDMTNVTATGNKSYNGGVLFASSAATKVYLKNSLWSGNKGTYGGAVCINDATFTVTDSEIKDNEADFGGAIYNKNGIINTENTSFTGNDSLKGNGGAVSLESGTLNAGTGTSFSNNTAAGSGGALSVSYLTNETDETGKGSSLVSSGASFSGNTAASSGGAVYVAAESSADITNASFTSNEANQGGAVYANSAVNIGLSGLSFEGNKAKANGGALYLYSVPVTSSDLDFISNTAAGHGGAAYLCAAELNLDADSVVRSNKATNHGGGFYLTYTTVGGVKNGAVLNATGTVFEENSAMAGGALSIRTNSSANLDSAVLKNNSVEGDDGKADGDADGGGAIYVGYGSLTLTNVTATGNTASDFGGAVDAAGAAVNVTGGTFSGNSSKAGGAVYATSDSVLSFSGTTFTDNESLFVQNSDAYDNSFGGGAIAAKSGKLDITGCTFDGNSTGFYGGALLANKVTVNVDKNSVFTRNEGGTGTALYFTNSCTVNMQDSFITDNETTSNGAVYVTASAVKMTNVTATGNTAANGAVLYASGAGSSVEIKDSAWSENSAVTGGTMHITDAAVTVSGCEISENTAQIGGAIYDAKGVLTLSGNEFTANSATANSEGKNGNGGAVSLSGATLNADGTNTFSGNTAAGHGGAVYVAYSNNSDGTKRPGVLNMGADVIENGSAMGGGAISVRTECEANLNGTVLKNNGAEGYADKNDADGEQGGAIYVGYGSLTMTNVTATGNTASNFGGAVNAVSADVTVSGGTFENNSSAGEGGAIYLKNTTDLTLTETAFNGNTATGKGGAVSTSTSSPNLVINATGCTFDANKSLTAGAGAVEIQNGNCNSATDPEKVSIVFTGCAFIDNESVKSTGGAVEIRTNSCAKFDGITATGNKAAANGGAVYVTSNYSRVYITGDVTASGNSGNGGADSTFIHLYNSNYSNPPRIYTTYGEDAPWYTTALIGGNRSSITFNMTALP